MKRRPPRSTLDRSSAASDVYKRQGEITSIVSAVNAGIISKESAVKINPLVEDWESELEKINQEEEKKTKQQQDNIVLPGIKHE